LCVRARSQRLQFCVMTAHACRYGLPLPRDEGEWSPLLFAETLATKKGAREQRKRVLAEGAAWLEQAKVCDM